MEKSQLLVAPKGWGTRHTFAVMSFLGFANVFAMRVSLSVAIVSMVNSTTSNLNGSDSDIGQECPLDDNDEPEESDAKGEFNWDSTQQGLILGSFFFGNIIGQIPGGMAAERISGKWVYLLGVLFSALATILTPLATELGVAAFIVLRALQGFGQSVTFPAMFSLLGKWIPPQERSTLASLIWSGTQFGTFVSLPVSGLLASEYGWRSTFYFFGAFGITWSLAYMYVCHDSPDVHPRISLEEQKFLQHYTTASKGENGERIPGPPFKLILTSVPFYAVLCAHIGNNWGMYMLLTEIPTYLNNIQHFSLKSNGLLSGLPYILMWAFALICGAATDKILRVKPFGASTTTIRKIMNVIGHLGPAIGLIGLSFNGCNKTLAIFWVCIAVMLNGAMYSGFGINHVELSPNYAGTLMGFTNMAANIAGFFAPYATGFITDGNQTLDAWMTVFLITAGVYVTDIIIFTIFGTSETQKWNTYWIKEQ